MMTYDNAVREGMLRPHHSRQGKMTLLNGKPAGRVQVRSGPEKQGMLGLFDLGIPSDGGPVGGGGDYGGGGGYGAFDPAPILAQFAALRAALQAQADAANTQIGGNADQWRQRLAALQADQTKMETQTLQNILAANQQQQANYQAAVAPVTADLQAQGFSAAPVQQTATLDDQHLKDLAERQRQLSQRFSEINQRSYTDRQAAEAGQTAGAKNIVAMKLADYMLQLEQAQAEALGSGGGGGGGGGYGGGGGGGGYDTYTSGDATTLGALGEMLPDARDFGGGAVYGSPTAQELATQILYGSGGQRYKVGGKLLKPLGHLGEGGGIRGNPNAAGQVVHKYLAQLKRKGIPLGMRRGEFVNQFVTNIAQGQKDRRKAKTKRQNYKVRAAARNLP